MSTYQEREDAKQDAKDERAAEKAVEKAAKDAPPPTRSYPRVIEADGLTVTVNSEGEEAHYLAAKGRREKAEAEAKTLEDATPPPAPEADPEDEAAKPRRGK